MSARRLWPVLLLVPLGLVTGHQATYAVLHDHPSGLAPAHDHGHIGLLASLSLPLAVAGAAWLARRANRRLIVPALAVLAGVQVPAFAVMETVERLAAGGDVATLARSPLLWTGVAIQIAVALVVSLSLGSVGRAATALLLRSSAVLASAPRATLALPPTTAPPPRLPAAARWVLRRGPPHLLLPHH